MNFKDVELMQNALQNTGNDALKRRAMDQQQQNEMNRIALQREMMANRAEADKASGEAQAAHWTEQGKRYDKMTQLEQDRANAAEKAAERAGQPKPPTVKAWLPDPTNPNDPNAGMQFEGTVDQYNQLIAAAKQKGYTVNPQARPPSSIASKEPVATFRVGGVTHSFWDEGKAQEYENALKAKGIDPYQAKQKTGQETTYQYDDFGNKLRSTTRPLGEGDSSDSEDSNPAVNTPAQPTAVPDTRGIFSRIWNSKPVPVPQPSPTTSTPPIQLTPDDLKVAPNPNQPQAGVTPATQQISDMVRVQSPDGRTGRIPRSNLQAALLNRFKLLEQPTAQVPGVGSAQP